MKINEGLKKLVERIKVNSKFMTPSSSKTKINDQENNCDIIILSLKMQSKSRNWQRWARITLFSKRNDLFNQQKRSAKCAVYFLIAEELRTFAINFLILLKSNAIPQLQKGVLVPHQSAIYLNSAFKISKTQFKYRGFAILDRKKVSNLLNTLTFISIAFETKQS